VSKVYEKEAPKYLTLTQNYHTMPENNNNTNNNRQKVEQDTKKCKFLATTVDHMSYFVHKMEQRMHQASLLQILQQKPACTCQNFPMRDYLLA
jgi:hypothetical protein